SRAWFMREEVLEAVKQAVEGGVGFLYQSQIGFQSPGFNETVNALHGMSEVEFFCGPMGNIDGIVVSRHPLIGTLGSKVGARIQVGHTMGVMGSFSGTPLIASPDRTGRSGVSG